MKDMRFLFSAVAVAGLLVAGSAGAEGLTAARISDDGGPIIDPAAALWAKIEPVKVAMQPQVVTTPANPEPSIAELSVRAVHNGQWLSFLIEWADVTVNDRLNVSEFGDQVAVELPNSFEKDNPPNPMMGSPDAAVTIMQWRAAFQHDLDKGDVKLSDLYPNAQVDFYPSNFLRETDGRSYSGALGLDNPISHAMTSPVLDQMAKGFGSLTVKPEQVATGKGFWNNGQWHVVISRPLSTRADTDPRLIPGSETVVAFAVWDGGKREVGSRKAWADWVPLSLAK